jgi:hypothetical protein
MEVTGREIASAEVSDGSGLESSDVVGLGEVGEDASIPSMLEVVVDEAISGEPVSDMLTTVTVLLV